MPIAEQLTDLAQRPIHFGGAPLDRYRHVCAFFDGPEDEYRVTVPFLKEALDRKERAFYIVDPEVQADTVRRFREAGVEAKESSDVRDCEICTWRDTYLRGGRFQGAAMLALIEDILTSGRPRFGLTRVIGHVEWAPDDPESTNDLLEYETRLNFVLPKYPDPVICAYQTSKWRGGAVMDILRTHPMVMIGGMLHENPIFVPPAEFLRELRERSGTASA
jgi:hypothetical protein